jgi:FkbH-like protein
LQRSDQYQGNLQRELLRSSSTDVAGYLKSLEMKLIWGPFDSVSLQRVVQLINKTNQFNLTTRRYTESDVAALMKVPSSLTLQLRLIDKFGDNGIIAVVIGQPARALRDAMHVDTWLMSCRVLGRKVEEATLNLIARHAVRVGSKSLVGEYRPTAKNGMVRDHYSKLGFSQVSKAVDGTTLWQRSLEGFAYYDVPMELQECGRD